MAIINSYINIPTEIMNVVNFLTTICLLMAMVALGLNVSLKDLRHRAFKPLIAIIITSICLSVFTFYLLTLFIKRTIPSLLNHNFKKSLDSN